MRRAVAPRQEGGFTLVELLVAMAAGIVVLIGATTLIIVSLTTSARVADRVTAVSQARGAMEQLVQELNSGCLANDVSPVQAATASGITPAVSSDGSDLVFVSGLGDSATATPVEHVISIAGGALVDTSYANTGGSPPALNAPATWTFNSTPMARRVLVAHAAQINAATPLFQFYSYSNPGNPTVNSLQDAAALAASPLSASDAATVAQVDIAFQVAPPDGLTDASRVIAMQDSVVFRLTPASPTDTNYPCD